MDNHYEVDETKYHARQLMEPVRKLRTEFSRLEDLFAAMDTMKDNEIDIGEPPDETLRFAKVVDLFGVQGADQAAKLATAKAIYDELNSTVNGAGKAALLQLLARLG